MSSQILDHREKVFQYFLYKTGKENDSNDLTQEVFERVVNRWDQLHSINDLSAWLFRISRNILIDYYRKNSRMKELETMNEDADDSSPQLDQEEWMENMLECQENFLQKLDPETKWLIQKADLEGVSQKVLAAESGMVYATVRSKIQRGRNQLKQMFLKACEMEYDAAGNLSSCSQKSSCSSDC